TGNRGGESRSSALWGRSGRGAVVALVAAFALLAPLAAFAGGGNGNGNGPKSAFFKKGWAKQYGGATDGGIADPTFVQNGLWQQAKQHGNDRIHVIIQSASGSGDAEAAFGKADNLGDGDRLSKRLNLVGAIAVDIRAKRLAKLAQNPNLIITPDSP